MSPYRQPEDPNHPLNAEPRRFYTPGVSPWAGPNSQGYGMAPAGYQPAQADESYYARNPSLGPSPAVRRMSAGSFGMGQKMAALRDPVNMDAGRMQASLARATAPMTPQEHKQILAQYGGRGYMAPVAPPASQAMGGGGLLASAKPGPAMPGPPPAMSGPRGLMSGPPAQSPAQIGAAPARQYDLGNGGFAQMRAQQSDGYTGPAPQLTTIDPKGSPASMMIASRQAISPVQQRPSPMITPMPAAPPPAMPPVAAARSPFIGSQDMMRWFPQIQQEDAVRNQIMASQLLESDLRNRMMSSQISAFDRNAAMGPMEMSVHDRNKGGGYLNFDEYNKAALAARQADSMSLAAVKPNVPMPAGIQGVQPPAQARQPAPDVANAEAMLTAGGMLPALSDSQGMPVSDPNTVRRALEARSMPGAADPNSPNSMAAKAVLKSRDPSAFARAAIPERPGDVPENSFVARMMAGPYWWFNNPDQYIQDQHATARWLGSQTPQDPMMGRWRGFNPASLAAMAAYLP